MAGHRLRNLFTALAAAVCLATGAVGQTSNSSGTALYNPATPGYSSILVYDALVSVYNAYKYGAPFSALQLPYPDSLFYIVCQTLATTPGDNVVALHPTFPIGKTINQAVAAGFPLAINQATAVNAAASQFLGDRILFEASFPYGPSGRGNAPSFTKTVTGITVYGSFNDTGKIFTCSSGTLETPL
ncbi:hypothetical protein WJX74_007161 [Apatococcus lobatus]|uniref:Uncharacterized protein n=1 Tax=Apatococcus lobatus TaxID=904363 RepID=A0AAW1RFW3_9CHLO